MSAGIDTPSGWGDRIRDTGCKKMTPHPRHTWGTSTCAGVADWPDPNALTSQQPRDDATSVSGSMRPMQTPGEIDRPHGARPASSYRRGAIVGYDGTTVPEGFTVISARNAGGLATVVLYLLCCDGCGAIVGNVPAHRVFCS